MPFSESFYNSHSLDINLLKKEMTEWKAPTNLRETPSDSYFQLQNARLDLVRQLEQGRRRNHQLQRSSCSPSQTTAGLCPLAVCSNPLPLASLPQKTLVFWEIHTILHYSAPTAKGTHPWQAPGIS